MKVRISAVGKEYRIPFKAKIMGRQMGLNPAVLLLSLSVWGSLLGILGMVIALPMTTLLITYYHRYVIKSKNSVPEQKV